MKVVLLNGGKGTRLGLTDRPKPMVPVCGKPLLERLVEAARSSGFQDFVFLNGHLAEVIEDHFGDGSSFGVRIDHILEPQALGTAGTFHFARHLLTEPFLVIYGDILIDVDLTRFAEFHFSKGGVATLFVHPNDHQHDSDLVVVDGKAQITKFLPKPHPVGVNLPNLVSGALYVLDPAAIDYVPKGISSDWGRDIFPDMVNRGAVMHGYRSLEYAKDIGTPDRLAKGENDLLLGRPSRRSRNNPKPAVFLDRDGVLNVEINGVHRPDDLVLIEGVGPAVRRLNRAGLPAICVTNQPDLAKGLMTAADLADVFSALDTRLADHNAYLDDVYVCPHHPERGWPGEVEHLKVECDCRKPGPGMLKAAAKAHNLDLGRSWLIGDRYADIAAAKAVGASAVLVLSGHAGSDQGWFDCVPDHVASNLDDAITFVIERMQ